MAESVHHIRQLNTAPVPHEKPRLPTPQATLDDNGADPSRSFGVCFVVVWFGAWPPWLPFFLLSCGRNPGFHWMIWSDCTTALPCPTNVTIRPLSRAELERRVSLVLNADFHLDAGYKLCDLKPVYGDVFSSELEPWEFWGYVDLDVVYGRLADFITPSDLESCDILTSSTRILAGHFTILRNTPALRGLYRRCPDFLPALLAAEHRAFDETEFSSSAAHHAAEGRLRIRRVALNTEDSLVRVAGRRTFLIIWSRGCLWDTAALQPLGYFHFIESKKNRVFRVPECQPSDTGFALTSSGFILTSGIAGRCRLAWHLGRIAVKTLPWYATRLAAAITCRVRGA
jgi:hypothetical protein